MVAAVLYTPILDTLGADIVSGRITPGSSLTLESIQSRFAVSRTVARECMRILESMRLVRSQRRTGIVVQPREFWNVYDPQIIRWRLDSDDHPNQLRSLTELRIGVEPFAANLAASRATEQERDMLRHTASEMRVFGETGRLDLYLEADLRFHRTVLKASHNEMYAALVEPVIQAVLERPLQGQTHTYPVPKAIDLHELAMLAICRGDGFSAELAILDLLSDLRSGLGAASADSAPIVGPVSAKHAHLSHQARSGTASTDG